MGALKNWYLTPERLSKKTRNCREYIQDVRAWLIAALGAAERITRRDSRHTTCRENEREPCRHHDTLIWVAGVKPALGVMAGEGFYALIDIVIG